MHIAAFMLRAWLIAGVLSTGVPAWQHAHAASEPSHGHTHGHTHGRDHRHDQDGMGECHSHLHFWLLGVLFTVPVQSDDSDSNQEQTTFLVASPTVIDAAQPLHLVCPVLSISHVAEPALFVPSFRCIAAAAPPLCDAARHERSGVLLV